MVIVMAMPPVDRSSDRPAYKQVADLLRVRMDAGEFDTDRRLPSETMIMAECAVSRATARRGLGMLIGEGRAEAVRGRGVFVKPAPPRLVIRDPAWSLLTHPHMAAIAEKQSFGYCYDRALDIRELPANLLIASLLRIDPGTTVLGRLRLVHLRPPKSTSWRPAKIANSYLPTDVALDAVRQRDTGPGGTYGRLNDGGHPLTHYNETVLVRMPLPAEARRLQLGDGIPVIDQTRVAFSGDRPVECFLAVMAGDLHELEYRIDARATTDSEPVEMPTPQALASAPAATGSLDDVPADIDPAGDRPLYKQIADWLRRAIERGVLTPNMRLPSESSLMRRFHTTRTTVRRALEELAHEGRIRARRGVGVFVKAPVRGDALVRQPYDRMARHRRQQGQSPVYVDAASRGWSPGDVVQDGIALDEVIAPARVTEWLNPGADEPPRVFRRQRRLWVGSMPTQLTASYIPLDIAIGQLREESTGDGGTHARIEELGYELTEFVERLSARMPTDGERRRLRLEQGVPVVDLVQTTYAGDRAVECFVSVIAGDRHVFRYRIDAA